MKDAQTTNNDLTKTWDNYNQVKNSGDRKLANKLLVDFISELKRQSISTTDNFVDKICELAFNSDTAKVASTDQNIQHPLFKEIILPRLIEQYKNNSPKHIKWIGQFEQRFYSDHSMTTKFLKDLGIEGYFDTNYFLEKSFLIDNNQTTLDLLLDRIAKDINYDIHEVPLGVLVDPEVFDKELNYFKTYWKQSDKKNIWKDILVEWENVAFHWRTYFAMQDKYSGFEDYLNDKGIKLD